MTTTEQARELAAVFDLLPAITWTGHRGDDYACILAPGQTTEDATIHLYDTSNERVVAIADVLSQSRAAATALRSLADEVERLTGDASAKSETYRQMHEVAVELGYPSILEALEALTALTKERDALREALNTPETVDFVKGVQVEAAHQRDRWGADHDAGKTPFDWFWLVGYLAQKAADAAVRDDAEKAKHHTISTAAALANWHLALSGVDRRMRPGIDGAALNAGGEL